MNTAFNLIYLFEIVIHVIKYGCVMVWLYLIYIYLNKNPDLLHSNICLIYLMDVCKISSLPGLS